MVLSFFLIVLLKYVLLPWYFACLVWNVDFILSFQTSLSNCPSYSLSCPGIFGNDRQNFGSCLSQCPVKKEFFSHRLSDIILSFQNFYLIDPYLAAFLCILMSRRLIWCIVQEVCPDDFVNWKREFKRKVFKR